MRTREFSAATTSNILWPTGDDSSTTYPLDRPSLSTISTMAPLAPLDRQRHLPCLHHLSHRNESAHSMLCDQLLCININKINYIIDFIDQSVKSICAHSSQKRRSAVRNNHHKVNVNLHLPIVSSQLPVVFLKARKENKLVKNSGDSPAVLSRLTA